MTYSERIARIKTQICGCGAKLRGKEIQCKDCRDKELVEEALD